MTTYQIIGDEIVRDGRMWDPNTWALDTPERFVYGDDLAQIAASVDDIDYQWAIRHRWTVKHSRGNKMYLRRAVGESSGGVRLRTFTLYLHVEIMKRTGVFPASERHTIVDHKDGNSLNCKRDNLRWATPRENCLNLFGAYVRQGRML